MTRRFPISKTFKVSGALFALGIVLASLFPSDSPPQIFGVLFIVCASPVFTVSAIRHLLRGILWRVGSRLLVSYLLIGVVPIPFFLGFLYAGVTALCGQMAATRAARALQDPKRELRVHTEKLGFALAERAGAVDEEAFISTFLEKNPTGQEKTGAILIRAEGANKVWGDLSLTSDAAAGLKERKHPSFFITVGPDIYFAAAVPVGSSTLVLFSPVSDGVVESVKKRTGIRVRVSPSTIHEETGDEPASASPGKGVQITAGNKRFRVETEKTKPAPPKTSSERKVVDLTETGGPISGMWIHWFTLMDAPVFDWKNGAFDKEKRIFLGVRSSIAQEMSAVLWLEGGGAGQDTKTGRIVFAVMKVLAIITISVYFIASLLAALLVFRIARATKRLSDGFDAIERGDFSHRLKFGGQDQLASLIESFNRMTSHLGESVEARARQEALELELGLARDLQKRLLPPAGFTFPGVEIAVDFRPAAAIGGDFYHLIAEGDRCLAVVIADVSGHGLPTGIVMASAKASLSSLARSGAETVEMLKSLDEEIRKTTDARTFVTLAYLRFRFDRGFIEYTNAGHIYPYRVSPDGSVTSIENPARPLGLSLHATFRTVETPLVAGDTWVLLSDGIIEAQSESGEVFGFERFEALLARCGGKSAAEVKEVILKEWKAFNGSEEPADDVTLVVLRILEAAST